MTKWNLGETFTIGDQSLRGATVVRFKVRGMVFAGQFALGVGQRGIVLELTEGIQGCPLLLSSDQHGIPVGEILGDIDDFRRLVLEEWPGHQCRRSTTTLPTGEWFLSLNDMAVVEAFGPGFWSDPFTRFTLFVAEAEVNANTRQGVLALLGKPPFLATAWRVTIWSPKTQIQIE